jgi:hypothetical protein
VADHFANTKLALRGRAGRLVFHRLVWGSFTLGAAAGCGPLAQSDRAISSTR